MLLPIWRLDTMRPAIRAGFCSANPASTSARRPVRSKGAAERLVAEGLQPAHVLDALLPEFVFARPLIHGYLLRRPTG